MGVKKTITKEGDGSSTASKGSNIAMHYTGWIFTEGAPGNKGNKFDSSVDRGKPFDARIGVGALIKGWDDGILGLGGDPPMTLGEKATLLITPDYGYGASGYPPIIPKNATLIFDVELLGIDGKRA